MRIAIFKAGRTPVYMTSVDGSEYTVDPSAPEVVPNDPDVIFNPNVSAVMGVPLKFWKRSGSSAIEMTLAEKQAVMDAELQARKNQANDFNVGDMKIIMTALIKVLNTKLPANKQITKQEMVDAIKLEIT